MARHDERHSTENFFHKTLTHFMNRSINRLGTIKGLNKLECTNIRSKHKITVMHSNLLIETRSNYAVIRFLISIPSDPYLNLNKL